LGLFQFLETRNGLCESRRDASTGRNPQMGRRPIRRSAQVRRSSYDLGFCRRDGSTLGQDRHGERKRTANDSPTGVCTFARVKTTTNRTKDRRTRLTSASAQSDEHGEQTISGDWTGVLTELGETKKYNTGQGQEVIQKNYTIVFQFYFSFSLDHRIITVLGGYRN
jgi:hypothetical protein